MKEPQINYIGFPYILPGVHNQRCPKCGSSQLEIIGVKGVAGKNMGTLTAGIAGGAIGAGIAAAVENAKQKEMPLSTINYQCKACKEKFGAEPHMTEQADVLEAPFTVNFTRKAPFGDDPYQLYLNGVHVSTIPYLTSVWEFQTSVRRNTLLLIGFTGKTVKNGVYEFTATPGGSIKLLYTKKTFSVL